MIDILNRCNKTSPVSKVTMSELNYIDGTKKNTLKTTLQ